MEALLRLVSALWSPVPSWKDVASVDAMRRVFQIITRQVADITDHEYQSHIAFGRADSFGQLIAAIRTLFLRDLQVDSSAIARLSSDFLHDDITSGTTDRQDAVLQLLQLWLVAGVQSHHKQVFGETILTFTEAEQMELMQIIQDGMALVAPIAEVDDVNVSELHAEISALRDELQHLKVENTALKSKLHNSTAAVENNISSAKDTISQGTLRILETQVEDLNRLLRERDDDVKSLEQKVSKTWDEVRVLQETNRAQADELDVLRTRAAAVTRLESQLIKVKDQLAKSHDRVRVLESHESTHSSKIVDLEAERAGTAVLKEQIQDLRGKYSQCESLLAQANATIAIQKSELSRLHDERNAWLAKRTELESQMMDATERNTLTAESVRHAEEEAHDWKHKYEALHVEMLKKRQQLEEHVKQAAEAADDGFKSEIESLYQQVKDLEQALEQQTEHAETWKSKCMEAQRMADHNDHLKAELTTCQADLLSAKSTLAEHEKAESHLKARLEALGVADAKQHHDIDDLRNMNATMEREMAMLRSSLEEMAKRKEELEKRVAASTSQQPLTPRSPRDKSHAYLSTAIFEFGRDIQKNLLRGSLHAGAAYSQPSPADSVLSGSTATILAGGKSFLAQQRERAVKKVLSAS